MISFVSKSVVLSLALLFCPAQAMLPVAAAVAGAAEIAEVGVEAVKDAVVAIAPAAQVAEAKSFALGVKVGEFVSSVRAKLPAMPARPTTEQAKKAVQDAKDVVVTYAHKHPYAATAIAAAALTITGYAIYKYYQSKKASPKKK